MQTGCTAQTIALGKLPRISAAALGALEHQLRDQRLPAEEQAFLSARLESYRKAAALATGAGCGRLDCCMA